MRKPGLYLVLGALLTGCPGSGGDDAGDVRTTDTRTDTGGSVDARPDVRTDSGPGVDAQDVVVAADVLDVQTIDAQDVLTTDTQDVQVVDVQMVDVVDVARTDVVDARVDAGGPDVIGVDVSILDVGTADMGVADAGVVDAAPCVPATETCNGMDDDCDGLIDESMCTTHLMISEIVMTPTEAEFIEIHNPTATAIDLSNVYLSDNDQYFRTTVTTPPSPTIGNTDFIVRFPAGAMIPAGGYQTVATGHPGQFAPLFGGVCPTYYIARTTPILGACTSTVMRGVLGSTPTTPGLTNSGEPVILFQWNGMSDLVQDLDYVYYGAVTSNPGVNKTPGLTPPVDGPDLDSVATPYLPDMPGTIAPAHVAAGASVRCDYAEGTERSVGGNGVTGHDETSENLAVTWRITTPAAIVGDAGITNVNASPNAVNNCR